MMLALLFTPHDFDRALRRRRLAALGLMALGALVSTWGPAAA